MLTITPQQLAAFETAALQRHADHLARALAAAYPHTLVGSDAENTRFVGDAMVQAQRYGLSDVRDLDAYVEAAVLLGPDFVGRADTAWAAAVIGDTRGEKGARLLELARIALAAPPDEA